MILLLEMVNCCELTIQIFLKFTVPNIFENSQHFLFFIKQEIEVYGRRILENYDCIIYLSNCLVIILRDVLRRLRI